MTRHILPFLCIAATARADMTQRWSFNNAAGAANSGATIIDPISGATATVRGNGAVFTGTSLTLPGTTNGNQTGANISAHVDLPNGLVSPKANLTVELWATPVSAKNYQRLFDFGRTNYSGNAAIQGAGAAPGEILHTATTASAAGAMTASDTLMLAINRSTTANTQRIAGRLNGAPEILSDTGLTINPGTQYHFAFTYTDGVGTYPATGGRMAWYLNGNLATTKDVDFKLSAIEDVNNWLGRSQYGNDSCGHVTYNEVRLYNHAMSAAEISTSITAGPDPAFSAPVAVADSISMHRGQKSRIAVLANDSGSISSTTVAIVQAPQFGTATPDASGKILYSHTTGTPASDSFTYHVRGPGGTSLPATVSVGFSGSLRIPNNSLNVPSSPPPVSIQAINAFPGLTFTAPTCLVTPPGDPKRLFVCTKGGTLHVIPDVTATAPVSSIVLTLSAAAGGLFDGRTPAEALSTASEQGLLGLAFHPNYASNGHLFIFYSVTFNSVTYERVSRLTLNNPASANPTANTASELILIEQTDQAGNHNGGDLHFGPDGYLYISLGDEGDQNDQRFNSQRIDKDFFSGILRIDVDKKPGNLEPNANPNPAEYPTTPPPDAVKRAGGVARYSIPVDNPFVPTSRGGSWNGSFNGSAIANSAYVRSEFWAVGLRNPWRFSFDTNGELWCGDVGGGAREEVNLVTRGGNYGWVWREGTITGPWASSTPAHSGPPGGFSSTDPLYNYPHGSGTFQGNSITGGFVYRGTRVPSLTGSYIFADFVSGNVWSLVRNGANPPTVSRILGEAGIAAFAPDPSNGDILMADYGDNRILRIANVTDPGTYPSTLGATNLFADLTDLSPAPGLLPYSVNLPFWSDHAIKRRWFVIPDAVSKMTWSRDGEWTFPAGQIWVKHFDIETTRGNPATKKRLETRLLVKNAAGAYGVSYRWNEAGTEATLAPDEGADFDLDLTVDGSPRTQHWRIPSRAECMACHTPQAGHALSANTRQLNLTGSIHGFAGNQLDLLRQAGYFNNTPGSTNLLPRHLRTDEAAYPVEARVRSYLAVNCAYCHKAGGTAAPAAWDGRHELTLDQTGLVNGNAGNNGGNPLNKLVVPGDTAHSIVLNRVAVTNGFTRMPPFGSTEPDTANIALLTDWINHSLPNRQTYADWRLARFGSADSPQGDPSFDADGDGHDNEAEFLALTDPLAGTSFMHPQVTAGPNETLISLTFPANRTAIIETSDNLLDWQPWDVPGNQDIPHPGGTLDLTGPTAGSSRFFRAFIREN